MIKLGSQKCMVIKNNNNNNTLLAVNVKTAGHVSYKAKKVRHCKLTSKILSVQNLTYWLQKIIFTQIWGTRIIILETICMTYMHLHAYEFSVSINL